MKLFQLPFSVDVTIIDYFQGVEMLWQFSNMI